MSFIDELEHELRAATQRRVRLTAARAPRPSAAKLGSVLSVGLILLVAFVLLQTRGSTPPEPHAAVAPGVAPRIVANFEAFRRPHLRADAVPENLRADLVPINCAGRGDVPPAVVAVDGQAAYQQVGCVVEPPAHRENLRVEPVPPRTPARHGASARPGRVYLGVAKPTAQVKALIHHLQYGQSRKLQLPAGSGTVWLIPSGGWLCDLVRSRVIGGPLFACEPVGEVIAKPPLWPGLQWGGFYIGIEPDRITRVAFQPPGGAVRPLQLHDHTIAAWVGAGARLIQYSAAGSESLQLQGVGAAQLRATRP